MWVRNLESAECCVARWPLCVVARVCFLTHSRRSDHSDEIGSGLLGRAVRHGNMLLLVSQICGTTTSLGAGASRVDTERLHTKHNSSAAP